MTIRTMEHAGEFDLLRNTIRGFLDLRTGWDSYQAQVPSETTIDAALTLVDELDHADILPEWVTSTAGSSILMRYRKDDVWYDWEFHSDGDVAVMRKPLFEKETYHDFTADDIRRFFSGELTA